MLACEQARPLHPLLVGALTDLPIHVAQAAVEQASAEAAAAANVAEHTGLDHDRAAVNHDPSPGITADP